MKFLLVLAGVAVIGAVGVFTYRDTVKKAHGLVDQIKRRRGK